MIIKDYYDDVFLGTLIEDNEIESANHVSSGKLSASMLSEPLQWQVLKMYGIFTRVIDPYLFGKFLRGNEVEESYLTRLSRKLYLFDRQKEVTYRGVVGRLDGMLKTEGSPMNVGDVPIEVKSIMNSKFKRIMKEGKAQRGHLLQGALYGLATGCEYFEIHYVSGEDYRTIVFLERTADYKNEIDKIIDTFNECIVQGVIPVFNPPEKWMADKKYSKFPDWQELTFEECQKKLAEYLKTKNI